MVRSPKVGRYQESTGGFYIRPNVQPRRNPATRASATRSVVSANDTLRARRGSGLALRPSLDGRVSPNDTFGDANATLAGASTTANAAGLASVPPGACEAPGAACAFGATCETGM